MLLNGPRPEGKGRLSSAPTRSPRALRASGLSLFVMVTTGAAAGCGLREAPAHSHEPVADVPSALELVAGAGTLVGLLWAGRLHEHGAIGFTNADASPRWVLDLPAAHIPTAAALGDQVAVVGGSASDSFALAGLEIEPVGAPGGYLAALDLASGTPRYAVAVLASEYVLLQSVGARPDGGAVMGGAFRGTITIGTFTLTARGNTDGFVASISPDGRVAWASRLGGEGADSVIQVLVLANGDIAVGGSFVFEATYGSRRLSPLVEKTIASDGFVGLLAPDGAARWLLPVGGAGNDSVNCLAATPSQLVVGGVLGDTAPLAGKVRITEGNDGFVLAMNRSDGRETWATMVIGPGYQSVELITVHGNQLVVGAASHGATASVDGYRVAGSAGLDVVVAFLNSSGRPLSAESVATPGNDVPVVLANAAGGLRLYGITRPSGKSAATFVRPLSHRAGP